MTIFAPEKVKLSEGGLPGAVAPDVAAMLERGLTAQDIATFWEQQDGAVQDTPAQQQQARHERRLGPNDALRGLLSQRAEVLVEMSSGGQDPDSGEYDKGQGTT